jgi:hypothetical protein
VWACTGYRREVIKGDLGYCQPANETLSGLTTPPGRSVLSFPHARPSMAWIVLRSSSAAWSL